MEMPDRKWGNSYRYGFNGKEDDNEVKGEGNQQDYGMRVYDPRLGRFLSIDPLTQKYPFYTPYQFAGNKPIWALDLDGAEELPYMDQYEYNGSWGSFDRLKAIPNAAGKIYNNAVAGTWNSGVANVRSVAKGTWTQDMGNELQQIGTGIKNEAVATYNYHADKSVGQQVKDFGKFLADPQRGEDVLEFGFGVYTGTKFGSGKGNLLKPTTNSKVVAQTALKQEAASSLTNGEALAAKYAKSRPKHRQSTINKVWERAQKNSLDGNVYDPNTGEMLSWDKFQSRFDQWHMGHKYGKEYRGLLDNLRKGKINEEQFLNEYHNADNYQPEAPKSNMSHKYEKKSGG
jgi:RHS repeat-associated protein